MTRFVVTRLRLRSHDQLEEFFTAGAAIVQQAQDSEGNLGVDALAEANDVWWSLTAWRDPMVIRAFIDGQPHKGATDRLNDWCDEATFVHWDQEDADLPDWQTCYERIVADGQSATLAHASPTNATRRFPEPVLPQPEN